MMGPFVDDEKLLRALWSFWIKPDGTIKSAAFKPRGREGISTDRIANRSLNEAISFLLQRMSPGSRAGSITVKDCNNVGVQIVPSPRENINPFHTEIYSSFPDTPLDSIQYKKLALLAVVEQ